jgi:type I restriction enzyme S subunit
MTLIGTKLADVVLGIETGRSPKTLERTALPSEPGILKVSAVSWGQFNAQAAKAMPEDFVGTPAHQVRRGDFIVSRANTPALTGAVAIAQVDHPNRYLSDKLLRLVLDRDKVHPPYLLHALRAPLARKHIESNASGTSDSMRNIAQDALLQTPVPLPGLAQQIRITSRLDEAFASIGCAKQAADDQDDAAGRLATAFLRTAFADVPVIATSTGRPGFQPLISLARLESGHTPSRRHPEWWGGDVPWLALPDIRKLHGLVADDTTEYTNDLGIVNSSARLLPVGTVCLCRDASIGFVTMLGRPMATSQHFCNWVCDPDKLDAEFLLYAFMASFDYLRDLGSGSVLKTIYMPTIESFHLCTPPLDEQRRIAKQLRGRLAQTYQLRTHLAERQALIERLPQRILTDAFGAAT